MSTVYYTCPWNSHYCLPPLFHQVALMFLLKVAAYRLKYDCMGGADHPPTLLTNVNSNWSFSRVTTHTHHTHTPTHTHRGDDNNLDTTVPYWHLKLQCLALQHGMEIADKVGRDSELDVSDSEPARQTRGSHMPTFSDICYVVMSRIFPCTILQ